MDRVVRRAETGVLPARVWRNGHPKEKSATSTTTSARRALRARTMGTLLKSIISAVVFTVLVIMVLAELATTSPRSWPAPVSWASRWVSARSRW